MKTDEIKVRKSLHLNQNMKKNIPDKRNMIQMLLKTQNLKQEILKEKKSKI